jgi:hypothetical protein
MSYELRVKSEELRARMKALAKEIKLVVIIINS